MDDSALDPYEVWIAPEILEDGYDRVYEIPLDEYQILFDLGIEMPKWFGTLIENPTQAWSERISSQKTTDEASKLIACQLAQFVPVAIVACGSELHCRCASNQRLDAASFFLKELRDPDDYLNALPENERVSFREVCHVSAFLHGFRESYPPQGGQWSRINSKPLLITDEYVHGSFGDFELTDRWNPSLLVFTASNGDSLMVNRCNEWGWWRCGSEDPITLAGESCLSFAHSFNQYLAGLVGRTNVESPAFDSYFLMNKQ